MSVETKIIQALKIHSRLQRSDLQKQTQVSRRTLSVKLRKMLDQGVIKKQIDLTDARRIIYSLNKTNGD